MILDTLAQLAASFAPTATGDNPQTASVFDILAAQEIAPGQEIVALIQVITAVTSAGAATCRFQIFGNATDPNFGSGNVVVADSGVIAKASLVAGYRSRIALKRADISAAYEAKSNFLRYFALNVNIGTAVLTAGAFSAWLLPAGGVQDNVAYASGYTV